jgi:hypothetical protein
LCIYVFALELQRAKSNIVIGTSILALYATNSLCFALELQRAKSNIVIGTSMLAPCKPTL